MLVWLARWTPTGVDFVRRARAAKNAERLGFQTKRGERTVAPANQPNGRQSALITRRQFVTRVGLAGASATAVATLFSGSAAAAPLQAPAYQAERAVSLWHIFSTIGSQED